MKSKIIAIGIFAITATIVAFYPMTQSSVNAGVRLTPVQPVKLTDNKPPRIQLAILLDTSSSMSGLINQTREQLWQVVNEFSQSTKNGVTPRLEVAVFEYGNSRLSAEQGHIRKVSGLTTELDEVSEALFSLTTDGGDEYCGYVIQTAINNLQWSESDQDIKAIFIAGNEPFTQGPVHFSTAIEAAKHKGIIVNTIHAGDFKVGADSGWKDGAILAGGDYMSIDQNHKVAHIQAPQDVAIAKLNAKLNKTYLPYGARGAAKAKRQLREDDKNRAISSGLMAKRAAAKASSMYNNSSWDLVDGLAQGKVKLEDVKEEELPQEMRKMDKEKQKIYVQQKADERNKVKEEIGRLSKARNEYVKQQKLKAPQPSVNTIEAALTSAIHKQGKKKNYEFKAN
jgi:hypothetical protein